MIHTLLHKANFPSALKNVQMSYLTTHFDMSVPLMIRVQQHFIEPSRKKPVCQMGMLSSPLKGNSSVLHIKR